MGNIPEEVLLALALKSEGGGGGGGTTNYNDLSNKPKIGGTTLSGNQSLTDLGIASETDLTSLSSAVNAIKDGQSIDSFSEVETALGNKMNDTAGIEVSAGVVSFVKED